MGSEEAVEEMDFKRECWGLWRQMALLNFLLSPKSLDEALLFSPKSLRTTFPHEIILFYPFRFLVESQIIAEKHKQSLKSKILPLSFLPPLVLVTSKKYRQQKGQPNTEN